MTNDSLENEMNRTDDLPDGFYLLKNAEEPNVSLVRLYGHPDFDGVRHIAFGPWDGAALMPVWDLRENSILSPAVISAGDTPTCDLDALVPNTAEIEQRVAEACAKLLEGGNFLSQESRVALAANGAAKAIRSGKWREYQ